MMEHRTVKPFQRYSISQKFPHRGNQLYFFENRAFWLWPESATALTHFFVNFKLYEVFHVNLELYKGFSYYTHHRSPLRCDNTIDEVRVKLTESITSHLATGRKKS